MRVRVDLHVHSVLSACCSRENTVVNIVNMSKLLGTRFLGVADHNSCLNFPAINELCQKEGIVAVPAMEVTTAEEIHVLCLFRDFPSAKTLSDEIAAGLPEIPLDLRFYHPQCVSDSSDGVTAFLPDLLNVACGFDLYSLESRTNELGGLIVPAHVDKQSASLLSVLAACPTTSGRIVSRCRAPVRTSLKESCRKDILFWRTATLIVWRICVRRTFISSLTATIWTDCSRS